MRAAVPLFVWSLISIGGCAQASHPPVALTDCRYETQRVGRDLLRVAYRMSVRNDSEKTVKAVRVTFATWAHPTLRDEGVRDERVVLAPHESRMFAFETSPLHPLSQHQPTSPATEATIACAVAGVRFADDSVWTSTPGGSAP